MRKRGDGVKIASGFKQKLALGFVFILILSYAAYHVVNIFSDDISTFAAGVTTESTTVSSVGYVFKDETVLTSEYTGLIDYLVSDGTKVSVGQEVAVAYKNGLQHQDYVSKINECIRVLEQSSAGAIDGIDIVSQRAENNNVYDSIIKMLASGETGGLGYEAEKLLVGMNTVRAILGTEDFSSEEALEVLYRERDKIFSESGKNVSCNVENTGYFFSGTDGNEELFTMEAVENLTADSFDRIIRKSRETDKIKGAYGKISYTYEWKLVMPISIEDARSLKEGEIYDGLFSENNRTSLPLKLEKIILDRSDDRAILIFYCDRQPTDFSFDRCQSVSITVKSVSGIYVPKSVVVRQDGIRGVYVLRGSVVRFRYIEIIHDGSDYYLVKRDSENDEERSFLRENDIIILNGRNLFDGRVMD